MTQAYLLPLEKRPVHSRLLVTIPSDGLFNFVVSAHIPLPERLTSETVPGHPLSLRLWNIIYVDNARKAGARDVSEEEFRKLLTRNNPDDSITVDGYSYKEMVDMFQRKNRRIGVRLRARSKTLVYEYCQGLDKTKFREELTRLTVQLQSSRSAINRWRKGDHITDGEGRFSKSDPKTPRAIRILYCLDKSSEHLLLRTFIREFKDEEAKTIKQKRQRSL